MIRKFFTKEDTFHSHKILGTISLVHFIYRFYNIILYNDPLFSDSYHTPLLIGVHLALSATSMLFHVPRNRIAKKPMIYREFRLHSILFAYRSIFVMYAIYFFSNITFFEDDSYFSNQRAIQITCSLITLLTFIGADVVTHYYKPEHTTMRDMPFSDYVPVTFIKYLNFFYSFSQVLASLNMIINPSLDTAFMVLFPIQIAAFLMTCVRKGVLGGDGWHILYAASLLLNYVRGAFLVGNVNYDYWIIALLFCILRFKLRLNKYALWTPILVYTAFKKTL